ncbi:MAG: prepilin-type N-terminal cleavage/methylation domain-containing protein [Paraglaciecola sp.]|nr:prepilin-type N-terminal cleavage/methylation domain-containing protein [Paraglaciecola sp.]
MTSSITNIAPPKSPQHLKGMTMVELMIVLAIIGLLIILVYPSYRQHIMESRRADGATQLLRIKMQQESYRLNHIGYAEASDLSLPVNEYYDFSVVGVSATTYTLVAIAKGSQTDDGACLTLALDQSMNKTPSTCW